MVFTNQKKAEYQKKEEIPCEFNKLSTLQV
jgi:hypothetical protein